MVFVDVGANDGYYTLFAARRVGPSGRVVAAEPSSRERAHLQRNLGRNGLDNVSVVPAAIGAAAGLADLHLAHGVHAGHNTLGSFAHDDVVRASLERVPIEPLDAVIARLGLARVDFVKIDVEGAEASVIAGAATVLSSMRPLMLLEVNDKALAGAGQLRRLPHGDPARRTALRDIRVFARDRPARTANRRSSALRQRRGHTGRARRRHGHGGLSHRPKASSRMPGRLKPAAAALLGWATDAAFPLWATTGFDFDHGRFEERLTLRAERLPGAPIRLLSQARQIYAYALAARRGWYPGAATLVEQAFASMVRDYRGRDGRGGWIFSIARDGAVSDPRRDFYAHTFVLLAIASYVQATGKRQALALADETLAFIDRDLRAPDGDGFVEVLPARRRSSPPEPAHASVRGSAFALGMLRRCTLPDAGRRAVRPVCLALLQTRSRHPGRVLHRRPPACRWRRRQPCRARTPLRMDLAAAALRADQRPFGAALCRCAVRLRRSIWI